MLNLHNKGGGVDYEQRMLKLRGHAAEPSLNWNNAEDKRKGGEDISVVVINRSTYERRDYQ